jgi:rhamnosyltransferase
VTVSIIMRTKDSDWVVGQALAALFSQRFRDFELIVVDSGSTDRTLSIVRKYPCRLLQIPAQSYYPGAVLNRAVAEARGDVLVYQNSDVVPLSPHTLDRLLAALDDPRVVASFARQIPRPEAHGWVRRDYAASFPERGPAPPWMPYSLPLAAMRRSAWEAHPFYTDAWGSEDTEWGTWARHRGHAVRYVPEAIVMHSHNYTLRELYGRRFIEGEADAFIQEDRDTPLRALGRTLGAAARDVVHHLGARDPVGLAAAPLRRVVSQLGYHRGHKHGEARRARGDGDASVGQRLVLERFGGAAAREVR